MKLKFIIHAPQPLMQYHDAKGLNLVEVLENEFHFCMYVHICVAKIEQTSAVFASY